MIKAQGGDPDAALPKAEHWHVVRAKESGYVSSLGAISVGVASWRLGAGRERKEDAVQFGAGIEIHAQVGTAVKAGDPVMTLYTETPERFERAIALAEEAIGISEREPAARKLVLGRVS
jgi:thymidine phosphorylase